MGISGNLQTMALAELLQWIAGGDKSGTLHLDNGSVEKKIYFVEGRIIGTSSSNPKEYLGHFLVGHGYINEVELAKALDMQEESKLLLGRILTSIGVISEEDLDRVLYMKSEECVYDLFAWPDGEFRFVDGELPKAGLQPIDMSVTAVILQGTRRLDEWARIHDLIPSMDAVAVSVGELTSDEPSAAAVLAAVNDDRTINEIALEAHTSQFHACSILVEQIEAGNLKVVRPREVASEASVAPVRTGERGVGLVEEARERMQNGDFVGGLRCLGAARSLEPDSAEVTSAFEEISQRLRQALADAGISMTSVPTVSKSFEDLNGLDLSSGEGFLFSRINGSLSIDTILKISPIDPLEAQACFLRLKNAGYIDLDDPA